MATETVASVLPGACLYVGRSLCLHVPTTFESAVGVWRTIGSWAFQAVMQPFKLKSIIGVPLIVSSLAASSAMTSQEFNALHYIDPLIGTMNGGK